MSKFKLNDLAGKDDYIFVTGNTKYLTDFNQAELAILHGNGDPRVSEDVKAKAEAPAEATVPGKK